MCIYPYAYLEYMHKIFEIDLWKYWRGIALLIRDITCHIITLDHMHVILNFKGVTVSNFTVFSNPDYALFLFCKRFSLFPICFLFR